MVNVSRGAQSVQASLPSHVQAQFTFLAGLVLRADGVSRPATLDEIEQAHGQAKLEEIMSYPGKWVDLILPAGSTRCRCWARYKGDVVFIILPKVGKVEIAVEQAAANKPLLAIFNRVLEADVYARQRSWAKDGSEKAHVELNDDEMAIVAASALKSITNRPRRPDLSKFPPAA